MSPVSFLAAAYLSCGFLLALYEHFGCRSFTTTGRKRTLANIVGMTVFWLPIYAMLVLAVLVAAFVDFSEEEVA